MIAGSPPEFTSPQPDTYRIRAGRSMIQAAGLPPIPIDLIERGARTLTNALTVMGIDPSGTTEGSEWTNAEVLAFEVLAELWDEIPALTIEKATG